MSALHAAIISLIPRLSCLAEKLHCRNSKSQTVTVSDCVSCSVLSELLLYLKTGYNTPHNPINLCYKSIVPCPSASFLVLTFTNVCSRATPNQYLSFQHSLNLFVSYCSPVVTKTQQDSWTPLLLVLHTSSSAFSTYNAQLVTKPVAQRSALNNHFSMSLLKRLKFLMVRQGKLTGAVHRTVAKH